MNNFVKGDVLRRIAQGNITSQDYRRVKDKIAIVEAITDYGGLFVEGGFGNMSQEYAHKVFELDNTWLDVFGVRHDR